MPDWMKFWEYGFEINEETSARYFADMIFPLYRPADRKQAVFVEPRLSHFGGETLFNFGLGYRKLLLNNQWLVGVNSFYDYETEHNHYRVGAGMEALSNFAEFRANGYFGLSPARTTTPGITANTVEEVVDGFDLEVGAPIPYYSRLKIFGSYEWYNFKQFKNREGWGVRAEYTPFPFVVIDVILNDNTKKDTDWTFRVAFRPPFGDNIAQPGRPHRSAFRRDDRIFPDSDMENRTLTLVERHHSIVVESYTQLPGQVNVEIRRGT